MNYYYGSLPSLLRNSLKFCSLSLYLPSIRSKSFPFTTKNHRVYAFDIQTKFYLFLVWCSARDLLLCHNFALFLPMDEVWNKKKVVIIISWMAYLLEGPEGGYKSHFPSPNFAQIPFPSLLFFQILKIPVPVPSVIPIPSDQIPVSVTQIPFSQWKCAQIPVPILPLQDPLVVVLVLSLNSPLICFKFSFIDWYFAVI